MKPAFSWLALLALAACEASTASAPELGPPRAPTPASAPRPARPAAPPVVDVNPRLLRRFRPLEARAAAAETAVVTLGRMLYFETRLSKGRDVSCNSCHPLERYGVDQRATSVGHRGQRGDRNAPTVYHAADQLAQFWDGRSPDVEDQAGQPLVNPTEMGMQGTQDVVAVLRRIPGYVTAFQAAYPGEAQPVTFDHVTKAIGAFERGLATPARWDRFLGGDATALSADEREGFKVFADIGCVECHTGQLIGGSMFQKAGRARPWPATGDPGRYRVTRAAVDRMVFKVPPLRNVTETGPYFHDGSVPSLTRAVEMMAEHQLDLSLPPEDVALIVAWLGSLKGDLPWAYIKAPELPPDRGD